MMRKTFCVLMILAAMVFSANAWAAWTSPAATTTLAHELLGAAYAPLAVSPGPIAFTYTAPMDFIPGDLITVTLSKGTFNDAGPYYLVSGGASVATQVSSTPAAKPFTSITFRVGAAGIATGASFSMSFDNDSVVNPLLLVNANLAVADVMTVTLTATNSTGTPLTTATSSVPVYTVAQQYTLALGTAANNLGASIIDVNAADPRTQFTEKPPLYAALTVYNSAATFAAVDTAPAVKAPALVDADTVTFTLTTSIGDFSDLDCDGSSGATNNTYVALAGAPAVKILYGVVSADKSTLTFTGKANLIYTTGASTSPIIVLKVKGTGTKLSPQSMTGTAVLNLSNASYLDDSFNLGTDFVWTINGAVFSVPYMNKDYTNYGTYVVITNASTNAADVTLDIIGDGGDVVNNIHLDSIADTTTALLTPQTLYSKIKAAAPAFFNNNVKFSGTFTLSVPPASVTAYAYQNQGTTAAKRPVPVLNYANWYQTNKD